MSKFKTRDLIVDVLDLDLYRVKLFHAFCRLRRLRSAKRKACRKTKQSSVLSGLDLRCLCPDVYYASWKISSDSGMWVATLSGRGKIVEAKIPKEWSIQQVKDYLVKVVETHKEATLSYNDSELVHTRVLGVSSDWLCVTSRDCERVDAWELNDEHNHTSS